MNDRKIYVRGLIAEKEEEFQVIETTMTNLAADIRFKVSGLAGLDELSDGLEWAEIALRQLRESSGKRRTLKSELAKLREGL